MNHKLHQNQVSCDHNTESMATIFKLSFDCFEEIFEWLSLQDLYAVGQTCKWLRQMAGSYFKLNYSAAPIGCASNGIYVSGSKLNGFSEFIRSASILLYRIDDGRFHYIDSKCSKAFKQLRFIFVNFSAPKSKHIEQVLNQIEMLEMSHCEIDDQFGSQILAFCINLKHFCVRNCEVSTDSNDQWLLREYPLLEHFEWIEENRNVHIDRIRTFFEQNTGIRSFATSASFLQSIASITIHLDDLAIDIDHLAVSEFVSIIQLLHELQQGGSYRRLHLYTTSLELDQTSVDNLAHLHALVKIYLRNIRNNVSFSRLIHLKELGIYLCSSCTAFDQIAKDLVNLERVYFWKANLFNIIPFLRHSAKLRKIKVQHFETDADFVSILTAANKERGHLIGAQKVTIYVNECVFLEFKWATNSTDLGFIHLKRADAYEWEHHFGY